ncbi:MAG: hypothetical protein FJ037_03910 [Chloroflexi bacterium]|nr:hypothetical protein [Chloroflexota bacterium]
MTGIFVDIKERYPDISAAEIEAAEERLQMIKAATGLDAVRYIFSEEGTSTGVQLGSLRFLMSNHSPVEFHRFTLGTTFDFVTSLTSMRFERKWKDYDFQAATMSAKLIVRGFAPSWSMELAAHGKNCNHLRDFVRDVLSLPSHS